MIHTMHDLLFIHIILFSFSFLFISFLSFFRCWCFFSVVIIYETFNELALFFFSFFDTVIFISAKNVCTSFCFILSLFLLCEWHNQANIRRIDPFFGWETDSLHLISAYILHTVLNWQTHINIRKVLHISIRLPFLFLSRLYWIHTIRISFAFKSHLFHILWSDNTNPFHSQYEIAIAQFSLNHTRTYTCKFLHWI